MEHGHQKNLFGSQSFLASAIFYTLSFYITWPIFFSVYIFHRQINKIGYDKGQFALPAIVSFVAPLQGFTNFLVYIHPCLSGSCWSYLTMFGSVFSQLGSVTKQQSESATSGGDDTAPSEQIPNIDPSAAIAARSHSSGISPSTPPVQNNVLPPITEGQGFSEHEQVLELALPSHFADGEIHLELLEKDEQQMCSAMSMNSHAPVEDEIAPKENKC